MWDAFYETFWPEVEVETFQFTTPKWEHHLEKNGPKVANVIKIGKEQLKVLTDDIIETLKMPPKNVLEIVPVFSKVLRHEFSIQKYYDLYRLRTNHSEKIQNNSIHNNIKLLN